MSATCRGEHAHVNASTGPRPASHRAHNFRSAGLRMTWLCPSALEADNRLDRLLDSVAQRDPRSCPSDFGNRISRFGNRDIIPASNGRQRNLQLRVSWSSLHHPPPGAPSPHAEGLTAGWSHHDTMSPKPPPAGVRHNAFSSGSTAFVVPSGILSQVPAAFAFPILIRHNAEGLTAG